MDGSRVVRSGLLLGGLVLLASGCENTATWDATCYPWSGGDPAPGSVHVRGDLPLDVVPGQEFTVRIDELGGNPGSGAQYAGGTISFLGAVSPGGSHYLETLPQTFTLTATGEPGEFVDVVVQTGDAAGPGAGEGATCEVAGGSGLLKAIPIIAPPDATTSTTTSSTTTTLPE